MFSRLKTVQYPSRHRFDWQVPHDGCRTHGGQPLILQDHGGKTLAAIAKFFIDPPCFAGISALYRRSQSQNQFAMTVIIQQGPGPTHFEVEGRRVTLAQGTYHVINPLQKGFPQSGKAFDGYWVALEQDFLRERRERAGIPKDSGPFDFAPGPHPVTPALRDQLKALDRLTTPAAPTGEWDVWFPLRVYNAMDDLLGHLWDVHPSGLKNRLKELGYRDPVDPRLHRAIQFMRGHLGDALDNAKMAKEAGLSESTFYRLFRAEFHCAPKDYLRRLRVEEAQRLHRTSAKPDWQAIAQAVGFESGWSLRRAIHTLERKTKTPRA